MIKKLRLKFVVIIMSMVTLMLCVIFGLVFYFTRANLEAESINMMEKIAEHPLQPFFPNELGEQVRLPYFTLQLGPRREVLSVGGGYFDLSDQGFLTDLTDAALTSPKSFGVIEAYNLRYYRVDTPLNRCLVFSDISSEIATLHSLMKTCLLIGGLSFFLFLLISVLLSKWAVKPVDSAWKQQRQFVADASHELKTPLTVIMTNAELAQNPAFDDAHKSQFLSSIFTMSQQMRGLIEQMLELARADQSEGMQDARKVDLSKLLSDSILPFEPVFFERNLSLKVEIEPAIQVEGHPAQLRQLVEILLDNAQKYAGPAATAWVSLRRSKKGRCLLTVANEGAPISAEALSHLFKRFYRADPARSRTGSFGLGLSIADSIVACHGGRLWAESGEGVNSFRVELRVQS